MVRKFPLEFDFNEDTDPVEELHRLRVATTKHFKTLDAIIEYHRSAPSIQEIKARLETGVAQKNAKAISSPKIRASKRPIRRRKTTKT